MSINPQGGCAAKLPGVALTDLLGDAYHTAYGECAAHPMMAPFDSARLDLAGVGALMASTDLMPVVGPDPEIAGRIAALHAMSDLFASGASPRWAMPMLVVCARELDQARGVLVGVLRACRAEGVAVAGGHTAMGREALVGLSVLGVPPPEGPLDKRGGQEGDRLFLSKPVGTGLILQAVAADDLPMNALHGALEAMLLSNRAASTAALAAGATASTDVSGFGLLGHLAEMLGAGVGARVKAGLVPLLPSVAGVSEAFRRGAAIKANHDYVSEHLVIGGVEDLASLAPLLDPQTNGGLLVTAPAERSSDLRAAGYVEIGEITRAPGIVVEDVGV